MKAGLGVWECAACRRIVFPQRFLCPGCGGSEWRRRRAPSGAVEEATIVRRAPGQAFGSPPRVGSVRIDGGPQIVARLGPGASAGMRVTLWEDEGVPVALPPGRRRGVMP